MAVILPSIFFAAKAQDDVKGSFEAGAHFGITQYYGDVYSPIFSWKQKGRFFGVHGRYNYNSKFCGRFAITGIQITAQDYNSKKSSQINRNINFKTPITEFSFVAEYNILGFSSGSKRKYPGMEPIKLSPYVFAGFDIYLFSPKASFGQAYYKVKTLDTEAGKQYRAFNLGIPFGVGLKYSPIRLWTIGLELGMRKTFTDYLDDVSGYYSDYNTVRDEQGETAALLSDPSRVLGNTTQRTGLRGKPTSRDWYLLIGLSVTKKLYFKNY